MDFLQLPGRAVLKRKSDDDIGRDVRDAADKEMKGYAELNEVQILRDMYPNYDPTSARGLKHLDHAIGEWLASISQCDNVHFSEETRWGMQNIVKSLVGSIVSAGYELWKIAQSRKKWAMTAWAVAGLGHIEDALEDTPFKNLGHLFSFDEVLKELDQLREMCEQMGSAMLSGKGYSIGPIEAQLQKLRALLPEPQSH